MKKKAICYTELAYVVGILALALGAALMERTDWGMSMVVAPAYVIHLKVSRILPWFTFGMSEYVLQAVVLALLSIVMGKFRKGYLFSFLTAVIYGFALDLAILLVAPIPVATVGAKLASYVLGMVFCSLGVSMLFHTYIAPEAYELFVKELARKYSREISRVKTVYDCCSCLLGVILSFAFFGLWHFEGVKAGTIVCALVNGWMIGRCSRILERIFDFRDGLKLRKLFECV